MTSPDPTALSTAALTQRLAALVGEERHVQVEFLLHLDAFDRRRAWLEAGFESLWAYCLEALHLREGPAGRRIGAMRVLRRFPALEGPLRDGRLCLSTITVLGPLLTPENLDDLVGRAAFKTKAEVERLAASLQPRTAPKEGVRKLAGVASSPSTTVHHDLELLLAASGSNDVPCRDSVPAPGTPPSPAPPAVTAPAAPARAEVRPVDAASYSLRVTLDAATKADLDALAALLSHQVPRGDLAGVLREAIRCALEKHGLRKGARAPARPAKRPSPPGAPGEARSTPPHTSAAPAHRPHIPAAVRREVWKRDGGRCAFVSEDGRRCGSTWQLELDHIRPVALGGASTASSLRLACRGHNLLYAERAFGKEHMANFTRGALFPG